MGSIDDAFDTIGITTEVAKDTHKRLEGEAGAANIALNKASTEQYSSDNLVYRLTAADRDQAVREGIIPKSYRDATFDLEKINTNLKIQYSKLGKWYGVYELEKYVQICQELLSAFRMKRLPQRSYIIGAPNGYGKTSFVIESLITLRKQGYFVVPYISLWELAQIRVENEVRIFQKIGKYKIENGETVLTTQNADELISKVPKVLTGRYSFSEYINADCLFVYFSELTSKEIESYMLKQLLEIRGAKGLPTIVMISSALTAYTSDRNLKQYVWDEIIDFSDEGKSLDRVYHISCYKRKVSGVDSRSENIDKDTGVVRKVGG